MFSGTFIFAGGGTGGHLYPGLAIARQVLSQSKGGGVRVLFVCSDRSLDAEILKKEGVEFVTLGARPFSIRPRAFARFCASWGKSVRESRRVIRGAAGGSAPGAPPDSGGVHVVAMGGYVAAPVVQGARVEGCPVTLVNLDAVPGKANRWIARRASGVFTAAPVHGPGTGPPAYARTWRSTGPIVRDAARATGTPRQSRLSLGLDPDRSTLLVTGGSQGAASINNFICAAADRLSGALAPGSGPGWQILHQCGKGHEESVARAYQRAGVPSVVRAFSDSMGEWWGAADLALSRAGAGSVAEAWCNRVPTIFMPYPYHRDQHQRLNAEPLVRAGGAILFTDFVDVDENIGRNLGPLRELIEEGPRRAAMQSALRRLPPADGERTIAAALMRR